MFDILLLLILGLAGAFSGLSIVDPARAFRYENFLQIRSIELTEFGRALQQGGGILGLLIGPAIGYTMIGPIGVVAVLASGLLAIAAYVR
ncbi:hypothetical protein [Natronocalculus amylovorans]|uniref:Uncharacterized protein n=1 Tax=Natronocalculus amylovorans TaxID=2917812 RepID=A0AAE3KAY2_9EURY|nr:hypothetical protein [Natronocalculus amylovorans]MCL9817124.1 hypothetical protein [Natronocalculus amylovorans]